MPRAGGEADKLGNRFERIWTVDCLLNVLTGEAKGITIESLDPERGVEFVVSMNDGGREYHSVKRQTTKNVWSLSELTAQKAKGRSTLGDLVDKVLVDESHRAVFVSKTTANELDDLWDLADRSPDSQTFDRRLDAQPRLKDVCRKYLTPLVGDIPTAWQVLRRFRVVGSTELELIRRVDQNISQSLYRPDGNTVDAESVRIALGEAIDGWLGAWISTEMVRDHLAERGWRERDWQRDTTLPERVANRNRSYIETVESELIHGAAIARKEANEAIDRLSDGCQQVFLIGAAGLGKSCTLAQVAHGLHAKSIPYLTLRLDIQTTVLTSEGLGRELGFPMSPAVVLAGLAHGQRSVLMIDQLDALSLVSGRNQHLWEVFEELLRESQRYPKMSVLLACREFDAANDHRLKRLLSDDTRCHKINLKPLLPSQVKEAVERAGVDPVRLSSHDMVLLQTPQNLSLFLQGGPQNHGEVRNVQTLLKHYWNYKQQRLGPNVRWLEVVKTLANWLSDHQTLSAPVEVLDGFRADVQAMASEHVLVTDDRSCRFFHESVFDYVFARTYVAQGGTAAKLLLGDEQHLFRRAQVRQILTYNRDRSVEDYLTDLQVLLSDFDIRPHLKKVVVDWLRDLPAPTLREWRIVQALANEAPVSEWWRTIPNGSVGWFDLLIADGTWLKWLRDEDGDTIQRTIWLLGQDAIMRHRSEKVVELIEPFLDGSPVWLDRFRTLISFCEPHHSRRMFELFLRSLREGWLDDAGEHWWHHLHDFPDEAPAEAVELLVTYIECQFVRRPTGDPFPSKTKELRFPVDYCSRLAVSAPEAFVAQVLPLVGAEIGKRPVSKDRSRDTIWHYTSLGRRRDFGESLLDGLGAAAENLATNAPDRFRALTAGMMSQISHSLGLILLRGWTANPSALADDCARYLGMHRSRMKIGYDITSASGGYGPDILSRRAINAVSPHCTPAVYSQLESAILGFRKTSESPQDSGYAQLFLLRELPVDRLSPAVRKRLDELYRKFPDVPSTRSKPPAALGMQRVTSPIPPEAMPKMSAKSWVSAMRSYSNDRPIMHRGRVRGSMHELGSALKREAQRDRPRYAHLMLELPDDINPVYFDDILYGLVAEERDRNSEKEGCPPLGIEELTAAIERVHTLPGRPCARSICHVIGGSAERKLPDGLLSILADYAINDSNPSKEDWLPPNDTKGVPMWGGDPLSSGMNSGRGSAAWAIGSMLFERPETWPQLENVVRALLVDPSIAVRSCVVRCLVALLNIDRELAVDMFLQLVDGAEPVLGTGEVDNFIHHGIYPHYPKLRPLLLRMLNFDDEKARQTAARQIAVASLDETYGTDDLAQAMAAGSDCRAACAGVYAFNLSNASVRDICREKLKIFFDDPEKTVRDEAGNCFRRLDGDIMVGEKELISAFINSPAFADDPDGLMFALDQANALIPDVVCSIPERLIELQDTVTDGESDRRSCYHLPELVLRLYRQSADATVKLRCLNAIDRMLARGIGGMDAELGKLER
ncbi:ATP-binding protein [Synoicihabitans lomoniglobus]|uniref:ATP-binding protein n=1 Tax=Synoicihabitans lomoniglobus TaxID=2909285 RepID=A0AAE9ZWP6_9BACT|nr:ATP-binding protein [Opitutaceae bacterium LMO-M01]WED64584.1 ATP-binding protein [Opitutaceae bacterium LMO-M01]